MYYAISVPLIMTESMQCWPYSYPCSWDINSLMGGLPKYVHNVSMKMTLCIWAVNIGLLTFYSQPICYMFIKIILEFRHKIQLNNCCHCFNINCSHLLLVPYNITGVYLTYSNNIDFPKCSIK